DAVASTRTVHRISQSCTGNPTSNVCSRTVCGLSRSCTNPYKPLVDVPSLVSGTVVSTHACPEGDVPHESLGRGLRKSSHPAGSHAVTCTTSPPRRRLNGNSSACVSVRPRYLIH